MLITSDTNKNGATSTGAKHSNRYAVWATAAIILFGISACNAPQTELATEKTKTTAPVITRQPLAGLHYLITMPGSAERSDIPSDDMKGYQSTADGLVFVAYEQQTTDYDFSKDQKLVEEVLSGACNGFSKGADGTETKRTVIQQGSWPGKESEGTVTDPKGGGYRLQVYLDSTKGRTMYLGMFGPQNTLHDTQAEAFFNSFAAP